MAIESKRGCGYRKVGGIYVVGKGMAVTCDRLPLAFPPCPTCGRKVQFTRGIALIEPRKLFGSHACNESRCPVCFPPSSKRKFYKIVNDNKIYLSNEELADDFVFNHGNLDLQKTRERLLKNKYVKLGNDEYFVEEVNHYLMWVGRKYYDEYSFIDEARRMGVSKRIPFIPFGLVPGKSVIYLAMKESTPVTRRTPYGTETTYYDGVFYAFVPTGFELLMKESEATPDIVKKYKERGITVVKVPDNDPDHVSRGFKPSQTPLKQSRQADILKYLIEEEEEEE